MQLLAISLIAHSCRLRFVRICLRDIIRSAEGNGFAVGGDVSRRRRVQVSRRMRIRSVFLSFTFSARFISLCTRSLHLRQLVNISLSPLPPKSVFLWYIPKLLHCCVDKIILFYYQLLCYCSMETMTNQFLFLPDFIQVIVKYIEAH